MSVVGFNPREEEARTIVSKFRGLRERYRPQTYATTAVLAILTVIAAQIVPDVQKFVLDNGLIQYVTLIILLDLADSIHLLQRPSKARIAKNQDESMPILTQTLLSCRNDNVDLLEYAGATTLPLIRAIQREGISLRILIQHPDTLEGHQKQRSISTLDTICNSIFNDAYKGSFEIRCYRLPYTLRGRRLGRELLELGWLTPDIQQKTAFGHGNPSFIVDLSDRNNEHFLTFFNKTFDTFWEDSRTESGKDVLAAIQSANK